jgi:photosystem II stability/assembly factor-like uncharacterized protein
MHFLLENSVKLKAKSLRFVLWLSALCFTLLAFNPTTTHEAEPATNIILQSKDGGQTWQDITQGLPEIEQSIGFYAGASEVYVSTNGVMYSSKSNLKTPVWEKENGIDARMSIAFNRSGAIAHSYDGKIFQKKPSSDPDSYRDWLPIYTNFKSQSVATFFEAPDGAVLFSTGRNFFRSTDKALTWKLVQNGWVGDILESEGVLLATGQKGIIRSTDHGEHWELVISEGGIGTAIERIDGGFAAIAYNTQTKSRRIHASFDDGKTWKAIDKGLPPSSNISSVKQMGGNLIVGHPDGIFRSSDMGKTWNVVHPGIDSWIPIFRTASNVAPSRDNRKVFMIYVSGNVLYAVARNSSGC